MALYSGMLNNLGVPNFTLNKTNEREIFAKI